MRKTAKRFALLAAASALLVTLLAGCGGDDLVKRVQAGDREYGKTYSAKGTDSLQTSFFTFNINRATLTDEVDDYVPEDDTHRFLVVNVTIKNTFDGDDPSIPMFDTDFTVSWENLNGIKPETPFADGQLPDEYDIFKGKSRTGDLIWIVPDDETGFVLSYTEKYDDNFEGNTFQISFTAGEADDATQAA